MPPRLHRLSKDALLDLRFCDLGIKVERTWLVEPLDIVDRELESRGLSFKPHYWLADEWFSPEGVPGVAIPFYLADPALTRLERSQMFEVEGRTQTECLRLIRHEVGHAIDTAYGLHKRRAWQRIFGRNSQPYPDAYRPRPASKRFVQHLDGWYAQSHPAEDFAETFAVWLRRGSKWRERYAGWPALKKLEFVNGLMDEIADAKPKVRSRAKPYSLAKLRHSLRTHYQRKRAHYDVGYSEAFDRDLMRLFSNAHVHRNQPTAASFLRKHRREIRHLVANWTGEYEFTLDQVLKEMAGRCRELKLRLAGAEAKAKIDFAILLAVHTVHYLHRGDEWHPV